MKTEQCQLLIVGGGPAGLAAALAARQQGVSDILLLEREERLGGVLPQCLHSGFGLEYFHQELTGPEYARRFIEQVRQAGIRCATNATLLALNSQRQATVVSPRLGRLQLTCGAVIMATGCRERPAGALDLPGTRPAGVLTAGTAQRMLNLDGLRVGQRVVVLGSGDVGLIMARRLHLEGQQVLAVVEQQPVAGGLPRNLRQCLDDFNIPLLLSHGVTQLHGQPRLSGVSIAALDETGRPIVGSERLLSCDTLLLSVGLIPENDLLRAAGLTMQANGAPTTDSCCHTAIDGVFVCGNARYVHALADQVSREAEAAGRAAAAFLGGQLGSQGMVEAPPPRSAPPSLAADSLLCTVCPRGCLLRLAANGQCSGQGCERGLQFAAQERDDPRRVFTTSVAGASHRVAVRSSAPLPLRLFGAALAELRAGEPFYDPKPGQILLRDLAASGVDLVCC